METFAEAREMVPDPSFSEERNRILQSLPWEEIDPPIRGVVQGFGAPPCAFPLQSCFGHFTPAGQPARDTLAPYPEPEAGPVLCQFGYLAFCLATMNQIDGRTSGSLRCL